MAANKAAQLSREDQLRKNPINNFTCCGVTMNLEEFRKHLSVQHGIDAEKIKGTRQMLCHIDGDYWYSFTYEYKLETGLVFTQYTEQARKKNDPMRF